MIVVGKIALMGDWDKSPVPWRCVAVRLVPSHHEGHGWDPTTQAMLLALQDHIRPRMNVLDFGAGVGTLALAALALGADYVDAVDNNPNCLQVVIRNRALNRMAGISGTLEECADAPEKAYDLILCNLLGGNPTIDCLPILAERLVQGGLVILTCQKDYRMFLIEEASRLGLRGKWTRHFKGDLHGAWSLGEFTR